MSPAGVTGSLPIRGPVLLLLLLLLLMPLGIQGSYLECPWNCSCTLLEVACPHSNLKKIPEDIPLNTRRLALPYNNLTDMSSVSLNILIDLVYLDCSHNALKDSLDATTFLGLPLIYLDLSFNQLESIEGSTFSMLPSLVVLKLNNNPLTMIEKDAFANNTGLRELNLSNALLTHLDVSTVSSLVNLRLLDLVDNPWHCDCDLRELCIWIELTSTSIPDPTKIVCATTTTGGNLQLAAVVERLNRYCFTNLKQNDYVFLMLIGFVIFSLGTVVAWVAGICFVLRNRLCRSSDDDEEYIEEEVVPEGLPPSRQLEKEGDHAFYVNAYV